MAYLFVIHETYMTHQHFLQTALATGTLAFQDRYRDSIDKPVPSLAEEATRLRREGWLGLTPAAGPNR